MLFRARSSNQINKKLIERDDQVRLELLRTELIGNKSVEITNMQQLRLYQHYLNRANRKQKFRVKQILEINQQYVCSKLCQNYSNIFFCRKILEISCQCIASQVMLELLRTELIENKSVEKKCREIGRNYQYVATSIISTLLEQS